MKIIVLLNEDFVLFTHFLDRAKAARDLGHEVVILAVMGAHRDRIEAAGFRTLDLGGRRRGFNPLAMLATIWRVRRIYRRERPDLAHHMAVKPIIIGGLAARLAGVPRVVNAPTGMGFVFTSKKPLARLLRPFVTLALRLSMSPPNARVIFQNRDDLEEMVRRGVARRGAVALIRGSGVDIERFRPRETPREDGPLRVSLVARMLWDKGVGEFVEAAKMLKARGVPVEMRLVGDTDAENPACVPPERLEAWAAEGAVRWLGRRDDMETVLAETDIACLPSYREGLPRALLEALAAGLPIVTTDANGCRDMVEEGRNGALVPVGDAEALAAAIERICGDGDLRREMGAVSRGLAEREFSSARIVAETLAVYQALETDPATAAAAAAWRSGRRSLV